MTRERGKIDRLRFAFVVELSLPLLPAGKASYSLSSIIARPVAIQDNPTIDVPPMTTNEKANGTKLNSILRQDLSSEIEPQAGFRMIVSVMDGINICTITVAIAKTSHAQKDPRKLSEWYGWGRVWWVGQSVVGGVEWNGWGRMG